MAQTLGQIRALYDAQLKESVLPFWLEHGMDRKYGGILTGLDRDGSVIETDKSVWFQGRALWTFSTAYRTVEPKAEYLEAATSLAHFLEDHCFDADGRMFFRVTRDGRPVIKRLRYFFSETFAIIGFAAYAEVTGDRTYADKAFALLRKVEEIRSTPGILIPKFNQETEPSIGFGGPMILLNVLSELRRVLPEKEDWINAYMDRLLHEVETYFVREDMKLVLEQCAPDGTFMTEHFEGRLLNPGHAIEGSWFIMNEGLARGDQHLIDLGLKMFDWMWDCGWDAEFGGIIQYRDALGKSPSEYHQDMKFWWPQCEAAIAALLAYSITGKTSYLDKFHQVHDYMQSRFPDSEYGEWYGYFHRDGTLATPIKGNLYKGPFHIPRLCMKVVEIIDSMDDGTKD
ncbi:MAG: AGE family epimerase/isomerase [Sphaerochaetaceae bacterium]|nr:AGE family epimerase/isomerase [Sphaerochaetaceae bacterium]